MLTFKKKKPKKTKNEVLNFCLPPLACEVTAQTLEMAWETRRESSANGCDCLAFHSHAD